MFLEGYHAVFTGNRNGGGPHLQGGQEPKGTLLSSCRMRQTTAKPVIFSYKCASTAPARAPAIFPVRHFSPLYGRDTRAAHFCLLVVPWPAAKQMSLGRSPRVCSATCTSQASSSSASTWAGRRRWNARPSVRWLRAPSKLCELTKTLPSSRLTPLPSLARSRWTWPSLLMLASASASSVVFRQQRQVHRSRSSAGACSQTSSCTRRAQCVTITSRGTSARGTAQCAT